MITNGCQLPDMYTGNGTRVLWASVVCPQIMNLRFSSSEGTILHVVKSLYDKMYFEQGSAVVSI